MGERTAKGLQGLKPGAASVAMCVHKASLRPWECKYTLGVSCTVCGESLGHGGGGGEHSMYATAVLEGMCRVYVGSMCYESAWSRSGSSVYGVGELSGACVREGLCKLAHTWMQEAYGWAGVGGFPEQLTGGAPCATAQNTRRCPGSGGRSTRSNRETGQNERSSYKQVQPQSQPGE